MEEDVELDFELLLDEVEDFGGADVVDERLELLLAVEPQPP